MPLGTDDNDEGDQNLGLSEEDIAKAAAADVNDDQGDNDDQDDDNQLSDVEKLAMDQGWTPKEDFQGNPDNWKPASQYVEWGEMKSSITNLTKAMKGMKRSHNEEIVDINLFHKANFESREKELQKQFAQAVEEGDLDGASAISAEQGQIAAQKSKLNTTAKTDEVAAGVLIAEWELENHWVNDTSDPRAGVAQSAYNLAVAKQMSESDTIEFVNETVAAKFPDGFSKASVNPNRTKASSHSNNGGGGGSRTKKLTMADCNPEELKFRDAYATDERFLKTVENIRKESK